MKLLPIIKNAGYRRKYGGSCMVDYLLGSKSLYTRCPDLWKTPHYPFHAAKNGTSLFCDFLEGLDYEVTIAHNGKEAFDLIRNGGYRIVVSDWEMPEMSGLELCRRIRSRGFGGYIYIILLTSHSGTANLIQGLNAGADDFVSKPFQPASNRTGIRSSSITRSRFELRRRISLPLSQTTMSSVAPRSTKPAMASSRKTSV